jgi:hypothetical protein
MTKPIFVSVILVIVLVGQVHGEHSKETNTILTGLGGVYVDVAPLAPEVEEKGITDLVLGAEVERRLHEAGILVLYADAQNQPSPGTPTLFLQVTALVDEYIEECIYAIRIELIQMVRLERDEDFPTFPVATWSTGGVSIHAKGWRQALINDAVRFVDEFVESYLAANPQHGSEPR